MNTDKAISRFIGEKVEYDNYGQYFWAIDKQGNKHMVAELRGWGAIQKLFENKNGSIDLDAAGIFQDKVGEWIADAINQKVNQQTTTPNL